MENVEIKKEEVKKPAKKKAAPKKEKMNTKQIFMMQCNDRRAKAGLPAAYSEEDINKAK